MSQADPPPAGSGRLSSIVIPIRNVSHYETHKYKFQIRSKNNWRLYTGKVIEEVQQLLFISGQIPESPDGQTPQDFESQCRLAWNNVISQLHAAGMSVSNLAKVTIFLSSRDYAKINSRIRQEFMEGHNPALTVIITDIYDESWFLEIEAIAVL